MASSGFGGPVGGTRVQQSDAAAVANALNATPTQADDKADDRGDAQADPRLHDPRFQKALSGFTALDDVEKLGAKNPLATELQLLITGLGKTATGQPAVPVGGSADQVIAEHFTALVSRLVTPDGKPGAAFSPEVAPEVLAAPWMTETFLVPASPSLLAGDAPLLSDKEAVPERSPQESRVRLVKLYQQLGDKMFERQASAQDPSTLLRTLAPSVQQKLTESAQFVGEAFAVLRAQAPALYERLPTTRGTTSDLRRAVATLVGTTDALTGKDTDIEIPSPALVKLEQAANSFGQALGLYSSKQQIGVKPTLVNAVGSQPANTSTTIADLGFAHGDVEALAIIVMMQGAKIEDDITSQQLNDMTQMNNQKAQLRDLQTKAQQAQTGLAQQEQNEYNALKAQGSIAPTITFDQYKTWRQCSYSAMQDQLDDKGQPAYVLPQPQLTMPMPAIPEWLRTGNVAGASAASAESLSQSYGIPPQLLAKLRKVFTDMKLDPTVTFESWLQNSVKLTPASNVDDLCANMDMVQSFLAQSPGDIVGAAEIASPQTADAKTLKLMKTKMEEIEKAVSLKKYFGTAVSDDYISGLQDDLSGLEAGPPPINAKTALEFNDWVGGVGAAKFKAYDAKVQQFAYQLNNVNADNFDLGNAQHKSMSEDGGSGGNAAGRGGQESWSDSRFNAQGGKDDNGMTVDKKSYSIKNGKIVVDEEVTMKGGETNRNGGWGDVNDQKFNVQDIQFNGNSEIAGDLAKAASSNGSLTIDPSGQSYSDTFDYKAKAGDNADGTTPEEARQNELDALGQALPDATDTLTALGDPSDDKSQWRQWARGKGLDPDFTNASAAASGKTPGVQVDAATGITLDHVGNLDMMTAQFQEIKDKMDTLNDMTDTAQIRLQAQMDRRSKLFETLSNLLKSMEGTSRTIQDNIK